MFPITDNDRQTDRQTTDKHLPKPNTRPNGQPKKKTVRFVISALVFIYLEKFTGILHNEF